MHRLACSADAASAAPSTEPLLTEKLIAISHVKRVLLRSCGATRDAALRSLGEGGRAAEEGVTRAKLEEMREGIERDIRKFRGLLAVPRPEPCGEYAGTDVAHLAART